MSRPVAASRRGALVHVGLGALSALLVGVLSSLAIVLATATAASAHVDFIGSVPQNVSTVAAPVEKVTFEFSGAADPIAGDFLIEGPSGASLPIASVGKDGDTRVVVRSATPLPTGRSKVTWALRGADGHKMTGTISFTVLATPATSVAPSGAATPSTTPSATVAAPVATNESSPLVTSSSSDGVVASAAELVATVGRWIVYSAALFVVGAFVYLVGVHRGTRREGRRIVFLIRRGAVIVVVGAIVEWFAQLVNPGSGSVGDVVSPTAWGDLLSSGFALGTLLRLVGAALVLRFVSIEVVAEDAVDFAELDRYDDLELLGGSTRDAGATALASSVSTSSLSRVRVESGPLAFVGALLLIISEAFIGHTTSAEPRALVIVSDAVHLAAAGVWVAGVWLLSWTLWQRRRRGEPLDARLLATRFSIVATWALVAVALSGTALAWAILETPGRLWTTDFGRILLMKVALVGVIAAIGLHNRRSLIPRLEIGDGGDRFVRTIAIESVLFIGVLIVTSFLVVSNPLS